MVKDNEMENKYEYTRAIRLNLSGEECSNISGKLDLDSMDLDSGLKILHERYSYLLDKYYELFYETVEGKAVPNGDLAIRKEWFRKFAREEFYSLDEKSRDGKGIFKLVLSRKEKGQLKILMDFSKKVFIPWYNRNIDFFNDLERFTLEKKESQSRRSDINLLIQEINKSENFAFLAHLTKEEMVVGSEVETKEKIASLQNSFTLFKGALEVVNFLLAPDKENGVRIAKASTNYYAVNKAESNWGDIEKQLDDQLKKDYSSYKRTFDSWGFKPSDYSLEVIADELKSFRAKMKKQRNESKQMKVSTREIDNILGLITVNGKTSTDKSNNSFKFYMDIRREWGEIKCKKRNLEQERIENRLLKYWALFYNEGSSEKVLLVPKENMNELRKDLSELRNESGNLKEVNSITLKSLKKLVRRNLSKEIPLLQENGRKLIDLYKRILNNQYPRSLKLQSEFTSDNPEIKDFLSKDYSRVEDFRMDFEKLAYQISYYDLDEENLEELKKKYGVLVVEPTGYDFVRKGMKRDTKNPYRVWSEISKNRFVVDENNSYRLNPELSIFYRPARKDLEEKEKRNRFSREHYGITFTVTSNSGEMQQNNSYLDQKEQAKMIEQFNLGVVENWAKNLGDNLWYYGIDRGAQELATLCVVKFSHEKYKQMLEEGKINEEIYHLSEEGIAPIPAKIVAYKIKKDCLRKTKKIVVDKKGTEKEIEVYKNPSYFLDENQDPDSEIFEKVEQGSLDLTSAKLIKGHIIINGDLMTRLNLKIAGAKRRLFENLQNLTGSIYRNNDGHFEICLKKWVNFKTGEEKDIIKGDIKMGRDDKEYDAEGRPNKDYFKKFIFYWSDELEEVCTGDAFLEDLNKYLAELRKSERGEIEEKYSISKINHYRDALSANAVGIISHLFEKYPGIINLENMSSKKHIESHQKRFVEIIHRQLEWALYSKFQKYGLVPPNLKNTILIRSEEGIQRLGIIHFIPIEYTSQNCPYCGSPNGIRNHNAYGHKYTCTNKKCNFDSDSNKKEPLEFIDNSDTSAAYNIAKSTLKKEDYSRKILR